MSQLAENLKTAKLTFKSVLELAYEKDPDMVDRLISELLETKPAKQSTVKLTQDEKEQRKKSRDAKKAHIDKFILDNGGEESVTQKQIQEEKKKYDKEKKSVASPVASPVLSPVESPAASPVASPETCTFEEESELEAEDSDEEKPKEKPKPKEEPKPKKEPKEKDKSKSKSKRSKIPETSSDSE